MPIYMQYEGINGSVTAAGHEKWIELDTCCLGYVRNLTSASGRGTNREASIPTVDEIAITKFMDCASTSLFKAGLWGEGKKVKIDFCKTDKDRWEAYFQIELENVLISNYNVGGKGGDSNDRPFEGFNLNFTKITYVTTLMDEKNGTGKPDRGMWDLAQGKGG